MSHRQVGIASRFQSAKPDRSGFHQPRATPGEAVKIAAARRSDRPVFLRGYLLSRPADTGCRLLKATGNDWPNRPNQRAETAIDRPVSGPDIASEFSDGDLGQGYAHFGDQCGFEQVRAIALCRKQRSIGTSRPARRLSRRHRSVSDIGVAFSRFHCIQQSAFGCNGSPVRRGYSGCRNDPRRVAADFDPVNATNGNRDRWITEGLVIRMGAAPMRLGLDDLNAELMFAEE